MTSDQDDLWQRVSRRVRWGLCPLALPVGLYVAWELTDLVLFTLMGRWRRLEPYEYELSVLVSPIFGPLAAALSVLLAMLVAPRRRVKVARVMFGIGGAIAAILFLQAIAMSGGAWQIIVLALGTFGAGAAAGLWLPRYLAAWQRRQVGTQQGSTPRELPYWTEWAAAIASAIVASGAIYAVCLLVVFDHMWFYGKHYAALRHGHPEAITGALIAAAWVACGSLAAPTPRVWVPFVLLCAAAAPIAWILAVMGPVSNWGPPVAEFIAGTSAAGVITAVVFAVLLALRERSRSSPQAQSRMQGE